MRLQGLNHGDIDARAAAHQQLCARLGRQALGTRGKLGVNDLVVRHCVDRELRRRAQRAFRRCEHTRSRHVCAFSLSVRDVLLSQAATFFSTFACGFANDKYLAPVRPQCQLSTASAAPASCLDTDDGLIAPCECIGSARLVHRECLARWQKRKSHSSRTCEICKRKRCGSLAPWLVQLDVLDRECFTRSVRTNPRYPEIYCAVLDDAARARLLELMQPGTLILKSKERANESDSCAAIARAHASADPLERDHALSLFASMLTLQRAQHWHRVAYLLYTYCLPHLYLILTSS